MQKLSTAVKRFIDISISASVLLCILPVMFATALAVFITMGRPVFFSQMRPGFQGTPFRLFKFRTMHAPKPGQDMATSDPHRLTSVGRFLRSSSLDELPTFWNVLKGDMSLVGPRPLLMEYLSRYTPEQARRHEVKPGVTGWAQVNGRNALSWEEKFRLDLWYVENRSLLLDVKILFITLVKVIRREGISHGGEATMPEFMGSHEHEQEHNKNLHEKGPCKP